MLQKAVEEKQTATKIENKTTLVQLPAGMADNLANKAGQSAPGADRPPSESGPSALGVRTVRPRSPDRPHHTRKPPMTCQHQWKKTTY
jgi:hypothetical protein